MGYGDIVIEKLREVGIFVNNPEKPRLAVEACLRIEDLMLRLNDRRNHVEQLWEQRRIQLDWCVQACQIYSDLRQVPLRSYRIATVNSGCTRDFDHRLRLGCENRTISSSDVILVKANLRWNSCQKTTKNCLTKPW